MKPSALELMQRLAALVPRPRLNNLIRFNGVLAPAFSNPIDPTLTYFSLLNDWVDLSLWAFFACIAKNDPKPTLFAADQAKIL